MTPLESDLLRMVSNAKYYNEKGSLIFDHAERIRKIVAKTMREINPEYKDNPKYVPTPTRVPDNEELQREETTEDAGDEQAEGPSRSERPPTEVNGDVEDGFEGLTFRNAQVKLLDGLIHMKDEKYALEWVLAWADANKPPATKRYSKVFTTDQTRKSIPTITWQSNIQCHYELS